jgi:hypothetical protein
MIDEDKRPVTVTVTGAAGQIAYDLLFRIDDRRSTAGDGVQLSAAVRHISAGPLLVAEGHDHLFGRAWSQRQLVCLFDVGEGNTVADESREAVLVLREFCGHLEDFRGVALGPDYGHLASEDRPEVDGLRLLVYRHCDELGTPLGRVSAVLMTAATPAASM